MKAERVLLIILSVLILCILYKKMNPQFERYDVTTSPTFAMYYADWCGWSKKALDDGFRVFADPGQYSWDTTISDRNTVQIQKIDVETEEGKALASQYEVKGFPTFILHKGDETIPYNGTRDIAGYKTFIEANA